MTRPHPVPVCTIASNNYLAMARVLAESYSRFHLGAPVFVCIVDRRDPLVAYDELPFTSVFVEDLGIPGFSNMAFRYSQIELSTAVKPYFLSHLRDEEKIGRVFYFDPDILICDRLDPLIAMLDSATILLTPHLTKPLGDDKLPSERSILRSGAYNLGFLGIRLDRGSKGFLEWWENRLSRYCLIDPPSGLFVDQSWMDLAPGLVDAVKIVRDPGCNVAYWNLAHRALSAAGEGYRVDGVPVRFMHFSGLDFDDLDSVSRHQNRLRLEQRADLDGPFSRYAELVRAAGYDSFSDLEYGFGVFRDVTARVPDGARRLLQRVDPGGIRWEDPFASADEDSFWRWITEPLPLDGGTLNRLALTVWEERKDLQAAFPHPTAADLRGYAVWLRRARDRGEVDALVVEGASIGGEFAPDTGQAVELILRLVRAGAGGVLIDWLNEPVTEPAGVAEPLITRLAMMIHGSRPDLVSSFAEPLGRQRRDYAVWIVAFGQQEFRLPPELIEPIVSSLGPEDHRRVESVRVATAVQDLRELLSLEASRTVTSWLRQPSAGDGGSPAAPHMAMIVHALRSDLQSLYADPLGADAVDYRAWFDARGRREHSLPAGLPQALESGDRAIDSAAASEVSAKRRSRRLRRETPPDSPLRGKCGASHGVNLAGYFDMPTGVSEMARASATVLESCGLPWVRVPLDADASSEPIRGLAHWPEGVPFPMTLLQANADVTPEVLRALPRAAIDGGHLIGYWYWELSSFPIEFSDRFSLLDEIWVASQFVHDAIAPVSPIPVKLVPPFVPNPQVCVFGRRRLFERERFVFFYSFDVGSVAERKNPFGAIETIRRLTSKTDRSVGLVLRVNRSELDRELVLSLRRSVRGLPIEIVTQRCTRRAFVELMAGCDAVLSLHRSEGLGLLPIEALWMGKPVVATAYGGVTDYLSPRTAFPVDFELVILDRDHPPYPRGSVWAEPDLDHAVHQMRLLIENGDDAQRRTLEGQRLVRSRFGLAAATHRYRRELARSFDHVLDPILSDGVRA